MAWWHILLIVYLALALISAIFQRRTLEERRAERRRRAYRPPVSYAERMDALTKQLLEASRAVDSVLQEIADARRGQEALLQEQVKEVERLSGVQEELQQRVTALQQVPLEVAEYFDDLVRRRDEERERRSAWRDWKLIIISAICSGAITVIIMLIFT